MDTTSDSSEPVSSQTVSDTSESEQSEPEQDLPAAVSTPEGMTVLNVVIPGGIVDLLIDMGIDSFKEGGVSENRTIMYCLCLGSVFIIIVAPGLPVFAPV